MTIPPDVAMTPEQQAVAIKLLEAVKNGGSVHMQIRDFLNELEPDPLDVIEKNLTVLHRYWMRTLEGTEPTSQASYATGQIGNALATLRARLSAKPEATEQGAWKPIETAEKDGRHRLVWCPENRNTYLVFWWDGAWRHAGNYNNPDLHEKPTHWRPVPVPP